MGFFLFFSLKNFFVLGASRCSTLRFFLRRKSRKVRLLGCVMNAFFLLFRRPKNELFEKSNVKPCGFSPWLLNFHSFFLCCTLFFFTYFSSTLIFPLFQGQFLNSSSYSTTSIVHNQVRGLHS